MGNPHEIGDYEMPPRRRRPDPLADAHQQVRDLQNKLFQLERQQHVEHVEAATQTHEVGSLKAHNRDLIIRLAIAQERAQAFQRALEAMIGLWSALGIGRQNADATGKPL